MTLTISELGAVEVAYWAVPERFLTHKMALQHGCKTIIPPVLRASAAATWRVQCAQAAEGEGGDLRGGQRHGTSTSLAAEVGAPDQGCSLPLGSAACHRRPGPWSHVQANEGEFAWQQRGFGPCCGRQSPEVLDDMITEPFEMHRH
jgi:hypothetical protein